MNFFVWEIVFIALFSLMTYIEPKRKIRAFIFCPQFIQCHAVPLLTKQSSFLMNCGWCHLFAQLFLAVYSHPESSKPVEASDSTLRKVLLSDTSIHNHHHLKFDFEFVASNWNWIKKEKLWFRVKRTTKKPVMWKVHRTRNHA